MDEYRLNCKRGRKDSRRDHCRRYELSSRRSDQSPRRYRSRSKSSDSYTDKNHRARHSTTNEPETTNLTDFSFSDYQSDLTKILVGFTSRDKIIDDPADFWLFVKKYEGMLKNSGQCILSDPEVLPNGVQGYQKYLNINLRLTIPFIELYGRLSSYDRSSKLSEYKVKQFLQIVMHYLDFRQKEKFAKLKKLRKSQANLPVAKFKQEIIDAVAREKVVLIAGDTGCGKRLIHSIRDNNEEIN